MILRYAYGYFVKSFLFIASFLIFECYAQQASVQLVKSYRFLYKLYSMEGCEVLPMDMQHLIAKDIIPAIFFPFLAKSFLKIIPLAGLPESWNDTGVTAIALSDDTAMCAVSSGNFFQIIKLKTEETISQGSSWDDIRSTCFNQNGSQLAIINDELRLRTYDLDNYQIKGPIALEGVEPIWVHHGSFAQMMFSPQNKLIILGLNRDHPINDAISEYNVETS